MARLGPKDSLRFVIFNIGDNDERAVRAWLKGALPPETYASIWKVSVVQHASGRPRADLWIRREVGEGLKRTITMAFRGERRPAVRTVLKRFLHKNKLKGGFPWFWRMDFFRPWRDREVRPVQQMEPRVAYTSIATWNVNGYHNKSEIIEDMLNREKVAICALQETLVGAASRPIRPKGYTSYSSPWEVGFRGHAVIVDNRLSSYRIPHDEKWLIHVKISNWRLDGVNPVFIHVLAVYFPSGGNFRGARSGKLKALNRIVGEISKKHPTDLILALGDWNMSYSDISNRLFTTRSRLIALQTSGSNISRFPVRGSPSAIDHMLGDGRIYNCFRKPIVRR
ncbi:Endonuclease/exonuclease/phosphatase, partial [Lenzites betulinus]